MLYPVRVQNTIKRVFCIEPAINTGINPKSPRHHNNDELSSTMGEDAHTFERTLEEAILHSDKTKMVCISSGIYKQLQSYLQELHEYREHHDNLDRVHSYDCYSPNYTF